MPPSLLFPNPAPVGPPEFVLDAEVASAWLLTHQPNWYASHVLSRMPLGVVTVPETWPVDLAKVLRSAERGKLTSAPDVTRFLAGFRWFRIWVDHETVQRAWHDTLSISRRTRLSIRFAVYLELARRLQLPLATTTPTLIRAAAVVGVPIFQP